ncbi:rhodanese-like domain-containing protein [Polaribacter sp. SA4-10]|uniref:rhodanese-like domain-containing protein n=1 Tax=Polaribacter sp. SA4-10 TaxID=754397 RepID=UPI001E394F06|nr:rhodanese-like domain-containing protein [Polaribacter sp. SA4-10]
MKYLIGVVLVTLFFVNCDKQQELKSISIIELKALLEKENIQLLDVRTENEVKEGFIKTAIFADFYDDNFYTKSTKQLEKKKPVYIYCRSGNRSGKALKILQKKGYDAYNVLGGYSKWKTEN